MRNPKAKSQNGLSGGFTLLEMVISTGLFGTLVVAAVSITLLASNAQIKAADIQAIQDNIRFSLELLTKELRTGRNYTLTSVCAASGSEISFDSTSGRRFYFLNSATQTIHRATQDLTSADCSNPQKAVPFTAEEVIVDRLSFRLIGQNVGSGDGQPLVTVNLRVRSREVKFGAETTMNLQTTVVQRLRDL